MFIEMVIEEIKYSIEDNNDINTESFWITTIKYMRTVTERWGGKGLSKV